MADIELVVKIPEKCYENLLKNYRFSNEEIPIVSLAIATGTPLPKGHGRLIDADDIRVIELEDSLHFMQYKKGDETDVYIDAPTIIEADKAESEDT